MKNQCKILFVVMSLLLSGISQGVMAQTVRTLALPQLLLGALSSEITVPVTLSCVGDESGIGFSIQFDTNAVSFLGWNPGAIGGALILVNTNQAQNGALGISASQASGKPFNRGEMTLLTLRFQTKTSLGKSLLRFADAPVQRQTVDANADGLDVAYISGAIDIVSRTLSVVDTRAASGGVAQVYIQSVFTGVENAVGFSLKYDQGSLSYLQARVPVGAQPAALFINTNKNGEIGVLLSKMNGESFPAGSNMLLQLDFSAANETVSAQIDFSDAPMKGEATDGEARILGLQFQSGTIRIAPETLFIGQVSVATNLDVVVPVYLTAQGVENAVSFTLQYDPSKIEYAGASFGHGIPVDSGNVLTANTQWTNQNLIGCGLVLRTGIFMESGAREIMTLRFRFPSGDSASIPVSFVDAPVKREVASVTAITVPTIFENGLLRIQMPARPVIRQLPAAQTVFFGGPVAFDVIVDSDSPVHYQWTRNGIDLPDATNATYALGRAVLRDEGNYAVFARNDAGTAWSGSVALIVQTPPIILAQPTSLVAAVGTNASFFISVEGSSPMSCQWRHNSNDMWGQGDRTLNLTQIQPSDAGEYVAVIRNQYGSVTSAPAILTITGDPPVFANVLKDRKVVKGQTNTFSSPALGWEPIGYQWFFENAPMAGARGFELSINSIQMTNAGKYFLLASNYFGANTSAVAEVTVLAPLRITSSKTTNTIVEGNSLTLNVIYEGTGLFQWQINGEAIPGATNDTYTITNAQPKDGGSYRVVMANEAEIVVGDIGDVVVTVPLSPPGDMFANRIWVEGTNGVVGSSNVQATVEPGEPLHAGKAGGRSIWYRWKAPDNGEAAISTSGSSFDTLLAIYTGSSVTSLSPVASDEDSGGYLTSAVKFPAQKDVEYQIAIDGFAGASGRTVLSWNMVSTPEPVPGIIHGPVDSIVERGSSVTLSVTTSGANLRYQWFRDGLALAGAIGSSLVLNNAQAADAGNYTVEVMNSGGSLTNRSAPARLEVYEITEGRPPAVLMGQDKVGKVEEEGAALKVRVQNFRWQVVRSLGLPVVAGYTLTYNGNNITATTEADENRDGRQISGHSVWYPLKNDYDGLWTISTEGSAFDTLLEVYYYDDASKRRLLTSDDNSGADKKTSVVRFSALASVEYWVRLSGINNADGKYQLHEVYEVPQSYRQWASQVSDGVSFQLQVPKNMPFRVESTRDLNGWNKVISTQTGSGTYTLPVEKYHQVDYQFYRAVLLLNP